MRKIYNRYYVYFKLQNLLNLQIRLNVGIQAKHTKTKLLFVTLLRNNKNTHFHQKNERK